MTRSPRPLAAALLAALLAAGTAAQTPTWDVEVLGAPGPNWSTVFVTGVNDAGQVIGNTYVEGWKRGWIAAPGEGVQLLPLPDGAIWSDVLDLNAHGVAVGQVLFDGSVSRGVVWRPGPSGHEPFLLPAGPGGWTPFDATAVNDRGDVVGKYGLLGGSYHWSETTQQLTQITTAQFPKVPIAINEQRQIVGGSYRMDLDEGVVELLGSPTGTTYNYLSTDILDMNDAGECAGYSTTTTSSNWKFVAVRRTDGPSWKLFNNTPVTSASAVSIAATGDTVFQLGASFGRHVWVEGFGTVPFESTPHDPAWDLSGSWNPAISRGGLLACTGVHDGTGAGGVLLLRPHGFDDLGGAAPGALGPPVLMGYGTPSPGQPVRLRLANAAPDGVAFFALSAASVPVHLFGGTLHANPVLVVLALPTDALGRVDLTTTWPVAPVGASVHVQAAVPDPEAAAGKSLSNALRAVTQ